MKQVNIHRLERAYNYLVKAEDVLNKTIDRLVETDNEDRIGARNQKASERVKDTWFQVRTEMEWLGRLIKVLKERNEEKQQ
jgi:hypothetical protein